MQRTGNILFLYNSTNDSNYANQLTTANSILNGMSASVFMQNWNNNQTILNHFNNIEQTTNENYTINDLIIIPVFNPNILEFYIIIANQENSNVLSFLKTNYSYNSSDLSKRYYEFSNKNAGQYIYKFRIQINNDYSFTVQNTNTYSLKVYYSVGYTPNYEFSISQNGKINIPGVLSMKNLNSTYMYNNNTLYTTNDNLTGYYYFNNYYNDTPAPTATPIPTATPTPTPAPDIETISEQIAQTNEKIDNLTNQITGYTNESGEYIAGAFEQQTHNFWGNSGDLSGEKQENDISNALGTIKDTISGEISQTEIAGALNNAEDKFKRILEYGKSNPQALDLRFEWPNIKYENMTIIESGEINFSAMCRDIEELGTVKNYVNIIATFGASIAIIKHVWNLLLATLGIDNPYLYEDEHGDVYTTETLDEMTGTKTTTITQTNGKGSRINHIYKQGFRR